MAHQLECFAYLAIATQTYERAARLLGAARSARQQLHAPLSDPQEIAEFDQAMGQLAEAIGAAGRDATIAQGTLPNLDAAVIFALEQG